MLKVRPDSSPLGCTLRMCFSLQSRLWEFLAAHCKHVCMAAFVQMCTFDRENGANIGLSLCYAIVKGNSIPMAFKPYDIILTQRTECPAAA